MENSTFGEECASIYMSQEGIDHDKVHKCMQDSFVKDSKGVIVDNTLLKEDKQWANNLGIFLHPSITINNITYRGDLNGYDIFRAVCVGFESMPDVCKGDNIFSVIEKLEESSSDRRASGHFAKTYHIVAAIVLVMLINFIALYAYRRYNKKKMNEELQMQVNSAVSQYFKLSG